MVQTGLALIVTAALIYFFKAEVHTALALTGLLWIILGLVMGERFTRTS